MTTNRSFAPLRWGAATAAVGLLLTGCTQDTEPDDQPTVNPPPVDVTTEAPDDTASAEPTPTATESAPAPSDPGTEEPTDAGSLPEWLTAGTPSASDPGGDEMLLPVGLRVGDHESFDRVVVELEGNGVPGWQVEYVEEALTDGKGDRLDVDGDAILQVYVSGTRYPDENEDHYDGPMVLDGEDVVEEVHYVGTFEGLTQLFIGVDDGQADFRVFPLADPARLVIDVRES